MKLVINDKMKIRKFTNMKAKQHTPEQRMNQRRNQSRNKKCFETNENGKCLGLGAVVIGRGW